MIQEIIIFVSKWSAEIATICTASGVLYISFFKIKRKVMKYLDVFDKLKSLEDQIEKKSSGLETKLDFVLKEFKPNSGSSLKDSVDKLSKDIVENTKLTHKILDRTTHLLENDDRAIFETDLQGNNAWGNKAFLDLINRQQSELKKLGLCSIFLEENKKETCFEWEDAVKKGRDIEKTVLIQNKKGQEFACKFKASKHNNCYIGSLTEISKM